MVAQLTCFRPRKHGIPEKAVFLDQGLQLKTENASTVDLLPLYMMGRNSLTPEEETVQKASQCATITANGIVEADESAPVDIKDSYVFGFVELAEDSPLVLSLGMSCGRMGHSNSWSAGEQPLLTPTRSHSGVPIRQPCPSRRSNSAKSQSTRKK